jgi:hypothetical protein
MTAALLDPEKESLLQARRIYIGFTLGSLGMKKKGEVGGKRSEEVGVGKGEKQPDAYFVEGFIVDEEDVEIVV